MLSCIRHRGSLDAWVEKLSTRPPPAEFRPILWLGLTQLLLLDGISDHAALHETLEAAKAARFPKAMIGFANGLFRNAQRQQKDLYAWLEKQPVWVRLSHPEALYHRWEEKWGAEKAEAICRWNQERSRTFVRATPATRQVTDELTPVEGHPGFYLLARGMSPTRLPDFAEGAWYVQDPSTAIAPALLDARAGEQVLDACAAPGGKSALIAEALGQAGKGLLAMDAHPGRLERLRENMLRLGLSGVETRCGEMRDLAEASFDAILLDVPCSNTGVLQRRPEARWRFTRRKLREHTDLQSRLLDDAVRLLKPGGRILYSTCSIEPEETTEQITDFLSRHPGFALESQRLLLPGEENCDGAFAARLTRSGS